jgi:hypothetical protein
VPLRPVAAIAVAGSLFAPVPAQAEEPAPRSPHVRVAYEAPVPGSVVRGFDPPEEAWLAGHRGVDLEATMGEVVSAAAGGTVTFAGAVAGERWVTLRHADGVLTSYGPLAEVAARAGAVVGRGEAIGTVAAGHAPIGVALHWGARRNGVYIDPLELLAATRWRPALIGPGGTRVGAAPEIETYGEWSGRRGVPGVLGYVEGSPLADPDGGGYQLPPNPNHAIGVAGLGSFTDRLPIDLGQLGYAPDDTTYLSYAGRTADVGDVGDPHRDQRVYGPEDTWSGVRAGAERLREQLRVQWSRSPGQAVDLIGHSMGGVVVTYYLLALHDPADPTLPPIGHVVTLGSPLEGADLATAARSATRNPLVLGAILGGARVVRQPVPRPDDPVADDLSLGSEVAGTISRGWEEARRDVYASPLATGTQVLTLGGSRDWVVPDHRSSLELGQHVVVPGGHDRMRRTEASRVVVHAFLSGDPVPGRAGGRGHHHSKLVGGAQRRFGAALGAAGQPWYPLPRTVRWGWQTLRGER